MFRKKAESYAVVDTAKEREGERWIERGKREEIALSSQTPQPSGTLWSCWWIPPQPTFTLTAF